MGRAAERAPSPGPAGHASTSLSALPSASLRDGEQRRTVSLSKGPLPEAHVETARPTKTSTPRLLECRRFKNNDYNTSSLFCAVTTSCVAQSVQAALEPLESNGAPSSTALTKFSRQG